METLNSDISLPRDKIAHVYLGEWGSEAFQTRTRNRIDWFVEQINGGSVLDIGCSEGILPILLGRKGIDVIGIDINPDALDYAKNLLAQEEPATINHVTFICDDFINGEWTGKTFDIVILGEIIEHFSNPEILIEKAICQLKPGGLLLVTTPFGYYPDPDHKFIFTLTSFLEYFKKHNISPLSLSIVDGYIRFSAKNIPPELNQWDAITKNLLPIAEDAVQEIQKMFHDQLNDMAKVRQELYAAIKELREENANIRNEINYLMAEKQELISTHQKLEDEYKVMLDNHKNLDEQNKVLQAEYQKAIKESENLKKQNE